MSRPAPLGAPGEARNVLAIKPFRRLWISLSLSSLGDWLSLLALVSLATILTEDNGPLVQYFAVSGVVVLKVLPSVLLSPIAGALADRVDRRLTMVVGDIIRGLLYISIPIVGRLDWLLIANFLAECVALFWGSAKNATVPDLVPKRRLEQANQLGLLTTYGSAPVAAGLFALLASFSSVLGALFPALQAPEADLALYINGAAFLVAAAVVWTLPIPRSRSVEGTPRPSVLRAVWDGWRFAGTTPLVRGLLLGMLGAFAAGGAVIGVARIFVGDLGAGNAGFGVMFGAVFTGMAIGMFAGPRVLRDFNRRRLFGLALGVSGFALLLVGLIPDMVMAAVLTTFLGVGAGVAWAIGLTMLGHEVEDEIRGRTFAFLHATARIVLMGSVAAAPLVAALIGSYGFEVGELSYDFHGTAGVLLIAAVLLVIVSFVAYRQMNDEHEVSLLAELVASLRGVPAKPAPESAGAGGMFLVLEGGEGAGKSTQTRQLAIWLREEGFDVLTTREPGATKIGMRLRAMLLDKENTGMSARAEALLYAADRAEHVDSVIRPALERGAIVISDRYVDSTLAYQGAGRELVQEEIAELNGWATGGLVPDLTILLDLPVGQGMERHGGRPADRLEAESDEFHERVRKGFLELADRDPDRYLVLDAQDPQEAVTKAIQRRLRPLLPDPVPDDAEEITGMLPVIRD
ncbi:dTMP kinase [Actinorugispora endophytica]|uniref:Thymidylate kinase n=1 Tax=Actinorugispora endophytica TaxID=1605990 RepID=A0A4R6V466_9ACTN|nr:dTMP kinase [Actinorugispora endophytica]TDQ54973.1 thymidylate kinase [Actinorugispora endophytica]